MLNILNWLKIAWLEYGIKTIVEKIPVVKTILAYIDGHKTEVGRILMFASALLALVHQQFPEFTLIANTEVYWGAIIGYLITELGLQHQTVKKLEGRL